MNLSWRDTYAEYLLASSQPVGARFSPIRFNAQRHDISPFSSTTLAIIRHPTQYAMERRYQPFKTRRSCMWRAATSETITYVGVDKTADSHRFCGTGSQNA